MQYSALTMTSNTHHRLSFGQKFRRFFSSPEMFYRVGARILTRIIWKPKFVDFKKYVPKEGPVLLISNHVSFLDGLMIHTAIPWREVHFIIDEDIYRIPAVKYFMDYAGAIPIKPTKHSVEKAFERAQEILAEGGVVCIFPEGSLSHTGNLHRFRFGVEWIANQNKVDIIPIAIKGLWGSIFSRKWWGAKYQWLPRGIWRPVALVCGEPIPWQQAKVNFLQRKIMELKDRQV